MFKTNNKKFNKGFTLIETFVAITVLVITVLGPMTLLSRALADSSTLKQRMTASYLAQEGLETVIFLRNTDSSYLSSLSTSVYQINLNGLTLEPCSPGTCDSNREVGISSPPGGSSKERLISSAVHWTDRYGNQSAVSSSYIILK